MRSKTASVDAIRATRLITAIKTPYLPNGKVDLASFDGLVERQIEGGPWGKDVGATSVQSEGLDDEESRRERTRGSMERPAIGQRGCARGRGEVGPARG